MEETQLNNYKVLIRCSTYNHSDYIKETLNGFVIQKTNFPFLCLIMDDASTDGEQLLIKKFIEDECDPNRTKIISNDDIAEVVMAHHRANPNCVLLAYLLKINLYGTGKKEPLIKPWQNQCKYIALCEGDDYWTAPYKLQKQVDFLESNPEYTMCFANAIEHWENDKSKEDKLFSNIEDRDYTGLEICKKWIVPTASTLFIKDIYESEIYQKAINNINFIYGDIILWLSCAHLGKIRGMSDVVSVYRRCNSGAVLSTHDNPIWLYKEALHVKTIYQVFGNKYKKCCEDIFYSNNAIYFLKFLRKRKFSSSYLFLKLSLKSSIKKTILNIYKVIKDKIASH